MRKSGLKKNAQNIRKKCAIITKENINFKKIQKFKTKKMQKFAKMLKNAKKIWEIH